MGKFIYGSTSREVAFEDRLLAHLRAVMAAKLRRGECFLFSWILEADEHATEQSVWVHPAIAMGFEIQCGTAKPLNAKWLEDLTRAANSNSGLTPRPEPVPVPA